MRICGFCVALDLITSFKDWLSLGKRVVEIENNILKEERVAFERLRAEVGSGFRHLVQDLGLTNACVGIGTCDAAPLQCTDSG